VYLHLVAEQSFVGAVHVLLLCVVHQLLLRPQALAAEMLAAELLGVAQLQATVIRARHAIFVVSYVLAILEAMQAAAMLLWSSKNGHRKKIFSIRNCWRNRHL
jgi:hypothetical protein